MSRISWTEIDNFHTVRKTLKTYPQLLCDVSKVKYKAKVKLHGTNAAVQIDYNGKVRAQSRTSLLASTGPDNAGFAKWVEEHVEEFRARFTPKEGVKVIFGEWCGPGIQKGVAVSQLPSKIFAVFAMRHIVGDFTTFTYEPHELEGVLGISGAYVIDWYNDGEEFYVDWSLGSDGLAPVLERINACVADVEACDPWIKAKFGISGLGEGLVFYPESHSGYKCFSDLCFKAKGEAHKTVGNTKPAQADPTVVNNARAFAEMVVTEARLEQGARHVAGGDLTFDMKNIGEFLKWIVNDVKKETSAELDASGLDEKLVNKMCSERARTWFLERFKKE